MIEVPKLIIFSSGTKDGCSSTTPLGFSNAGYRQENLGGGGSGFENLVYASRSGILDADIVAVVSNHAHGGIRERAERLGISFIHFNPSQRTNILKYVSMSYRDVVEKSGAEWVALSGWLKNMEGLAPRKTFNIHPALLSQCGGRFGGHGMYGSHVHNAVKEALDAGEISESGCSMHFVTDEYDRGPIFFERRVPLAKGMTADDIAKAIRNVEHEWQPRITDMVVHGEIRWDGQDPKTLVVPAELK